MGWKRFFRRKSWDAERANEIESYIEIETDENIARGMPAKESRQAAMRKFGNPAAVREQIYEWNSIAAIESVVQDLRYAFRQLLRAPAFTVFAVLTLAVGIGVNAAMFSAASLLTSWTLPVKDPDSLRRVTKNPKIPAGPISLNALISFSYGAFEEMQRRTTNFSDLVCVREGEGRIVVNAGGSVEPDRTRFVSGNYFRALGVEPAAGRLITTQDDRPDAKPVVVVSHRYWKYRLGGDNALLGNTILINDVPFVIAGVTPHGFRSDMPGAVPIDLTIPIQQMSRVDNQSSALTDRGDWNVCQVMGRLRAGANEEVARLELESVVRAAFAANPPDEPKGEILVRLSGVNGPGLFSLRQASAGDLATLLPAFLFVLGVAAVLLIACANLAGLLLARGEARKHEIATRISLGAGRARVLRQLLTENVLLALLGGGLGLVFALGLETVWNAYTLLEIDVIRSGRVLAFTAGLSVLTGILFGMAPALTITRTNLDPIMKRFSTGSYLGLRKGRKLITVQIALCVALLISAGVLLTSAAAARNTPLGYDPQRLITFTVDPSRTGYSADRIQAYLDTSISRLEGIPDITSATLARYWLWAGGTSYGACIDGGKNVGLDEVGPRFVETMKMKLLAGRDLDSNDVGSSSRSVLVNETLAHRHFPNENPLGQPVSLQRCGSPSELATIVGLVADARPFSQRPMTPMVFAPLRPKEKDFVTVAARYMGSAKTLIPTIRRAMLDVDPRPAIHSFSTQTERLNAYFAEEAFLPGILLFCGATALLLASIGIYGSLSYAVQRRKTEIGVRMALGALRSRVVRHIVWELLMPVIVGLAAGCLLAIAVTQILQSAVIGITTSLPLVALFTVCCVGAIAGVAAFLPAWRASGLNPLDALRHE